MLIFWDDPKRETNLETHGFNFVDLRDGFRWDTAMIHRAHPGDDGRERFLAIGFLKSDLVAMVFALLGTEAVSVISLRPASRKERALYGGKNT